jgi:hypothetical protein
MGNDNTPLNHDAIKDRLFDIISSMSASEKQDLLEVLEIMQASKSSERRGHQRTSPLPDTEFSMHEVLLKDCIQNISKSGAFIETGHCFSVGQRLTMAIRLPGNDEPLQLDGTIVRTESEGVAIEFDKNISDI